MPRSKIDPGCLSNGKLAAPVLTQISVERSPITFQVSEGKGTLRIGNVADCEMEPFRGPNGEVTTLRDSIFTTIPGAPAYVAKATKYKMNNPKLGQNIDLKDHNAIQGKFIFQS